MDAELDTNKVSGKGPKDLGDERTLTLRTEHLTFGEDQSFLFTLGGVALFVLLVAVATWWLSVRSSTRQMAGYADEAKKASTQAEARADTAIRAGFASLNKELKGWQDNVEAKNAEMRGDVDRIDGRATRIERTQVQLTRKVDQQRERFVTREAVQQIVRDGVVRSLRTSAAPRVSVEAVADRVLEKLRFDRKEMAGVLAPELEQIYKDQQKQSQDEATKVRTEAFNTQAVKDNNKKGIKAKKWKFWK